MNAVVAWMIALSLPQVPDYAYYSVVYNTEQECEIALQYAEQDSRITATCVGVVVWAPQKPTNQGR
jgi:hypothetical protein